VNKGLFENDRWSVRKWSSKTFLEILDICKEKVILFLWESLSLE
jgi:hypothetical protein